MKKIYALYATALLLFFISASCVSPGATQEYASENYYHIDGGITDQQEIDQYQEADQHQDADQYQDDGVAKNKREEKQKLLLLSAIQPTQSFLWGGEATITGTGLAPRPTSSLKIFFGAKRAKIVRITDDAVTVVIPKVNAPTNVNVKVEVNDQSAEILSFLYTKRKPQFETHGSAITNEEIELFLEEITKLYPTLTTQVSIGQSVNKQTIWALKISKDPTKNSESKPDVLFTSGVHAREQFPVYVMMRLIRDLVRGYQSDKEIRALVDQNELFFVLNLNPDGRGHDLPKSGTGKKNWRKNRRVSPGSVDLNRNSSHRWRAHYRGIAGVSDDPNSEVFRGPIPFSEPETQALRSLIKRKQFQLWLDIHAAAHTLYGLRYLPSHHHQAYKDFLAGFKRAQRRPYSQSILDPPGQQPTAPFTRSAVADLPGLLTSWAYYTEGTISLTLELPRTSNDFSEYFYPSTTKMEAEYTSNLQKALFFAISHAKRLPRRQRSKIKRFQITEIEWYNSSGKKVGPIADQSLSLRFKLKNNSTTAIKGLWATLSSNSAAVSIDSEYKSDFPTIAPGQSVKIEPTAKSVGFLVRFPNAVSKQAILMTLHLFDQDHNKWELFIGDIIKNP